MHNYTKHILSFFTFSLILFLFWYFRSIVIFIAISAVLSLLGEPIARFLNRIRIGRFRINPSLSAIFTLFLLLLIIFGFISAFIPLIIIQAQSLIEVDPVILLNNLTEPIMKSNFLYNRFHNFLDYTTLQTYIHDKLLVFFDFARLTQILNIIASLTGDFFLAVFSISFITFFFIKDPKMLYNIIITLTPIEHTEKAKQVMKDSKILLTRYFIGVFIQVLLIIGLISSGLTIIGVENAFLIGFLAGLLNVVPYLGPVIGALFGLIIALSTGLQAHPLSELYPLVLKILLVFGIIQLLDNIFFQPLIYSSSIKAHPLEIFLVILVAGNIGGIGVIVFAIPIYTIIRVIAKQFLNKFKIIKKLTDTYN